MLRRRMQCVTFSISCRQRCPARVLRSGVTTEPGSLTDPAENELVPRPYQETR